ADSSTGARSTAMVSQGRIGAVIAAKPIQRRSLLEEAAGITGLHSRRHEAELRLRGAETNLERLQDILDTLDSQMQGLKKQARQANRYRNLSDHIRKAEASLYHLRWLATSEGLEKHRHLLITANARVTELTRLAATATTRQAACAEGLPELRQLQAEAAAQLHRFTVARDGLDAEEKRIAEARLDTEHRLTQISSDISREKALAVDAGQAMAILNEQHQEIEAARQGEEETGETAKSDLAQANLSVTTLDRELSGLTDALAADQARRASLTRTIADLSERQARLSARAADAAGQRSRLEAEAIGADVLTTAESQLEKCSTDLEQARTGVETAETARSQGGEKVSQALAAQQLAFTALARLQAEEQALGDILKSHAGDQEWPALIDEVTVTPGYEAALGAALGEDLSAPADQPAPVHWKTLPPFASPAALAGGVPSLSQFVSGPDALCRCLGQIGVVEDAVAGDRLADQLLQGQCLVSLAGGLWRWDGFTVNAGAQTAAAARLQQRNRLDEIDGQLSDAEADASAAETATNATRDAATAAENHLKELRNTVAQADRGYLQARDTLGGIKENATHHRSRLTALGETENAVGVDLEETTGHRHRATENLAALPEPEAARQKIALMRTDLAQRRALQLERQSAFDTLVRAAEQRRNRLADINRETQSWNQRATGASQQIDQLSERRKGEQGDLERLRALPQQIQQQRKSLMDQIESSEGARTQAAEKLAEAENLLGDAEKALRLAETQLAQAREHRVRAEGLVEQSDQAINDLAERVREKLDVAPDQLAEIAGLDDGKALPELDATERKVERLIRERDTMGPVNLRAEQESLELKEQIETLDSERQDLLLAIDKLRKGISELNREGRQRLLQSFNQVNSHFQTLFKRLFGGGKAYLELTDSDDPLEAGLEIMASPPGKRLQNLSLLSGGEQALTALALLFGVFLTNPAPICVLDEVDAPLDDANVDRFCSMLDEMAATGRTRFLIITHHRLTMARMHRLFGVTMAERGVSQLVSVDLQQAEQIRQTA
ncbi:MAG TPA: chromosome partitioning protein ParA, partial [Rhodospirillales bacterium]|nr:chromosome partitioning protein ParA [Rhodospirillales bacterium]